MKEPEKDKNPKKKERKWQFFLWGILVGIVVSLFVSILNHIYFKKDLSIINTFNLYRTENKDEKPDSVPESDPPGVRTESPVYYVSDEPGIEFPEVPPLEEAPVLEDVEFFIEVPKTEEIVLLDKIISTRQVHVTPVENISSIPYSLIEIQQWSTPIRNSITYQRNHSVVKIKGLDISSLEVHYVNGEYYLCNGTVFYCIPNNSGFERLVEVHLPQK